MAVTRRDMLVAFRQMLVSKFDPDDAELAAQRLVDLFYSEKNTEYTLDLFVDTLSSNEITAGTITAGASDEYGIVHPTGLWEDLRFPAQGVSLFGVTDPPDRDGVTGLLLFDPDVIETIVGVAQMPHAWKSGTTVGPHCHVMIDAGTDIGVGTDTSRWTLQMAPFDVGDTWDQSTYPYSSTVDQTHTALVGGAAAHEIIEFDDLDMTGYQDSACIAWRLARIGNAAEDTYTGDVKLLDFDIHYRVNTLGSLAEFGEDE